MTKDLFDQRPRDPARPLTLSARYGLPASEKDASTRWTMELWFERYPVKDQEGLRSRLGGDDTEFLSAFTELYIHELLCCVGFELTLHPVMPNGIGTHPDFLVLRRGEPRFYVEVANVSRPAEEASRADQQNALFKALRNLRSRDFDISVRWVRTPTQAMSWTRVADEVGAWLLTLNPIGIELGSNRNPEAWATIKHRGFEARVQAIARPYAERGINRAPAVTVADEFACLDTNAAKARKKLKRKKNRYGKPDLPYLVTVNLLGEAASYEDLQEAAFGSELAVVERAHGGGTIIDVTRDRDGVLRPPPSGSGTGISGIVCLLRLAPQTFEDVEPVLFHNPHASLPLPKELWLMPQVPSGTRLEELAGKPYIPARSILGLDRKIVRP